MDEAMTRRARSQQVRQTVRVVAAAPSDVMHLLAASRAIEHRTDLAQPVSAFVHLSATLRIHRVTLLTLGRIPAHG